MAARKRTDPATELRELAASLEDPEAGPAPGYVLRGAEPWFRERGLALIRAAADARGMEVCAHDGKDPDFALARLLDDLASTGLFAAERFVLLRGVDAHLKKEGKQDSALTRGLLGFLGRGGGTFALASEGLRADHALAKAVKKSGGRLVDCRKLWETPPPWGAPDPRRAELVTWVVALAGDAGVRLVPEQALALVQAIGNDLFALAGEVEKLRATGVSEVLEGLDLAAGGKPWQIAEEIVAGRLTEALFQLESLFRGGFVQASGKRETKGSSLVVMLLGGLVRSVRSMLAAAETLASGADVAAAAAGAGASARDLERFEATVRRRRPADWARMLDELLELELRSKTGGTVDREDIALFALRWQRSARRA